jgi:hypothetical protein
MSGGAHVTSRLLGVIGELTTYEPYIATSITTTAAHANDTVNRLLQCSEILEKIVFFLNRPIWRLRLGALRRHPAPRTKRAPWLQRQLRRRPRPDLVRRTLLPRN